MRIPGWYNPLEDMRSVEAQRQAAGLKMTREERRHLKDVMGVSPKVFTSPTGMEDSFYLAPIDMSSHDRKTRRDLYRGLRSVFGEAAPLAPGLHDWSEGAIRTSDYAHPGVLAHELGHAQFYETPWGRVLTEINHAADRKAKWALPFAALKGPVGKAAPFVAAAAVAPKLLTEFEATRRGLAGMRAAGYSKEDIAGAKHLTGVDRAFGTYLAPAATTVGAAYGVQRLANALRKVRR